MRFKRTALFVGLCLALDCGAQDKSCEAALASRPSFIRRVLQFIFGAPERESLPGAGHAGEESSEATGEPKKQEHYESQNFETDTPPGNTPLVVHYSFNQAHAEYFESQRFRSVDAQSGIVYSPGSPPSRIQTGPPIPGPTLEVNAKALTTIGEWNWLLRPFGYVALGYSETNLIALATSPEGLMYRQLQTARDPLFIYLQPAPPVELSAQQREELTAVKNAPELIQYPAKIIEFVQELKRARREKSLTDIMVAREVAMFLQQNFKYEVHASAARGVLQFCARGALQCSPATVVWMVLLRSFFKVPCFAVSGYRSSADATDPGASVVLNQSTPHMYGAAYDDTIKRFVVVDPTSGEANEDKKNEDRRDPRFTDWPAPSKPKSGAEVPEASDEENLANSFRPELNLDWAKLFDRATTPAWRTELKTLRNQLELARTQTGLSPADEKIHTDVAYADDLAGFLPATPLLRYARDLASVPVEPLDIKRDYLKMQLLLRLAPYGGDLAQHSALWSEVFSRVRRISEAIPRTRPLKSTAEFSATLPGNLSRTLYAEQPNREHALRQLIRARTLVDFTSLKNPRFAASEKFERTFTPTDDENFDLVEAEDFEHHDKFEREGYPPSLDALRVAREEMLIPRYREPTRGRRTTPRTPKDGPSLTYILGDLSGSMANASRGLVRDRVTALWIDELMSENAASSIKYYGYRGTPEAPLSWLDFDTARRQFNDMLAVGEYFHSDSGNDLIAAFSLAAMDAIRLGRTFDIINFRIITDGAERFDFATLATIRDRLGANKRISLDVVTIAEGNEELRRFIEKSKTSNIINKGQFVHLTNAQVTWIVGDAQLNAAADMDWYLPRNYLDYQRVPDHLRRPLKELGRTAVPPAPLH